MLLLPGLAMAQPYAITRQYVTNAVNAPFSELSLAPKYPLSLWLDANYVTTPIEGTQQNWIDSSGNGKNATNATAGQRPIWHSYVLNNHPGFTFNGSSQFLTTPGFINSSYNSNMTVFVVSSRKVSLGNSGTISLGDFALAGTGSNTVSFVSRLNVYGVGGNGNNNGGNLFQQCGVMDMTAPAIMSWNYSSTNCVVTLNGCQAYDDANGNGNSQTYPYNRWVGTGGGVPVNVCFGNASILQPVGVGISFLNTGGNSGFWDGDLNEILVYQGSFTDDEHALMVKYLQKKWSLDARTVFFAGDSICAGFTITDGNNYPCRTMTLLGGIPYAAVTNNSKYTAVNIGWSGANVASNFVSLGTGVGAGLVNIFPFQFQRMVKPGDIAVLEGMTNDGHHGSGTNFVYTNYVTWCHKVRLSGAQVIAMSVLPRTNVTEVTTNAFEVFRLGINAMLRANWSTFADGFADVGNDPTIGTFQNSSNRLYYLDGCHPTSLGAAYMATNVANAILSVSGTTPNVIGNPVITVSASPTSYTNNSGAKEMVFVSGGTVSAVAINGTTVVAGSNTSVPLQNGDYVTVTYSSAPTISRKFY